MARDTDRKMISEAFRLAAGRHRPKNQWTLRWASRNELNAFDLHGHELNMTFSLKGRLTHLVHWNPLAERPSLASREVVETGKRDHVLKLVGITKAQVFAGQLMVQGQLD